MGCCRVGLPLPPCASCQQPASKRNGHDRRGRQKYACRACRRTFTEDSSSAFSGYRWPAEVILTAVRWYLAYPLSGLGSRSTVAARWDAPHGQALLLARASTGSRGIASASTSPDLDVWLVQFAEPQEPGA